MIAVIYESKDGKSYRIPTQQELDVKVPNVENKPSDRMAVENNRNFNTPGWGIDNYGDMFSNRQLLLLITLIKQFHSLRGTFEENEYAKVLVTYLAIWIDRIALTNTSLGRWDNTCQKYQHPFNRQAIPMTFDYPEINPFSSSTGSANNMLEWVLRYIEDESVTPFSSSFANASSGERGQFDIKSLTAVVTDPPYYDAIAYADISDFFYVWLKRTLGEVFPLNFSTPQTPKAEECTALKHHHQDSENEANAHFENKLTQIFDAIERQTSDMVSIMFAHQSTKAWTTLCNSILDARMNITGSWPMDTELTNRSISLSGAALESSVTVACRPSERKGFADFDEVKHDIRQLVKAEVEKLYGLGFRGADLLTACFGQAVSVFGHYKLVETAEGDPVSVGQLLEFAREAAAQALLEGVPGEPQTKFYCGWLQMNGMGECAFDDVNKYTRVGVNVEIRQLQSDRLLITEGSQQHLATAEEHLGNNETWGTQATDYMISQVHRMMMAYRMGNQVQLLKLVRELCPQSDAPQWRVLDFLGGHLPEGKDLNDVKGILASAEMLRQKCKEAVQHKEASFDFED